MALKKLDQRDFSGVVLRDVDAYAANPDEKSEVNVFHGLDIRFGTRSELDADFVERSIFRVSDSRLLRTLKLKEVNESHVYAIKRDQLYKTIRTIWLHALDVLTRTQIDAVARKLEPLTNVDEKTK